MKFFFLFVILYTCTVYAVHRKSSKLDVIQKCETQYAYTKSDFLIIFGYCVDFKFM